MSTTDEILTLLQPFVAQDLLLPRSLSSIEQDINDFILIKNKNKLIACAGLRKYDHHYGEIYALAINKNYQNQGYSRQLLANIIAQARQQKISYLFAISKHQKEWFIKQKFLIANLNDIPLVRQQKFDHQRQPNIFMKNLC